MTGIDRRNLIKLAASAGLVGAGAGRAIGRAPSPTGRRIEVIGHRGACALRPEHTLASYAKAISDGADLIEPDLQPTKDGVLIASHEFELSQVSDVAGHPEFASRRRSMTMGGKVHTGWFIEDFTFAEIKTLRLKERIPDIRPANTRYDGMFQIVSFDEIIDFVAAEAATHGRIIGLAPELKTPTHYASVGLPMIERFFDTVHAHSYMRTAPLIIQCFEPGPLRALAPRVAGIAAIRLMQLIDDDDMIPADIAAAGGKTSYRDMITAEGLKAIADYAQILSPDIRALIPLKADGRLGDPRPVIGWAKKAGLQVSGYEFRPENRFLAADFRGPGGPDARNPSGSVAEIQRYLEAGMDSFFTDDPGIGRKAVDGLHR